MYNNIKTMMSAWLGLESMVIGKPFCTKEVESIKT